MGDGVSRSQSDEKQSNGSQAAIRCCIELLTPTFPDGSMNQGKGFICSGCRQKSSVRYSMPHLEGCPVGFLMSERWKLLDLYADPEAEGESNETGKG